MLFTILFPDKNKDLVGGQQKYRQKRHYVAQMDLKMKVLMDLMRLEEKSSLFVVAGNFTKILNTWKGMT